MALPSRDPGYTFEAIYADETDEGAVTEAILAVLRSPRPTELEAAVGAEEAHLRDCRICVFERPEDACPTGKWHEARRRAAEEGSR